MKGNVNLANCINTHVIAYRLMGITFIILSLGFLIPITQLDYPVHFIIWVSFCELFSLSFFMYFTFYKRNVLKYCLIKNDNIEIYEKKTNKKVIILNKNDVYFAKYIDIWRIKIIINNNYLIVDRDFPEKIGINITYNRQCAKPKSWTDCKGEKKVGKKIKKYRYCVGFKNYEVELTWNLFYERVSDNGEFFFYYKDYNIDVCYDWKNGKRLYSIVLDNGDEHKVWTFDTIDEMVSYRFIDNKSLKELWNELEN